MKLRFFDLINSFGSAAVRLFLSLPGSGPYGHFTGRTSQSEGVPIIDGRTAYKMLYFYYAEEIFWHRGGY
jgi:hypothetical protein